MIRVENVSKTYATDNREVKALKNVNIEFPDNGMVFILGKSGSGKTTLMNMLGGFNKADVGKIFYMDNAKCVDILQMSDSEQEGYRNLILGYVFQDFNLLSHCNVEENIRFVLEQQLVEGKSIQNIDGKVRNIIRYVELEGMEKSRINELSGGQIQRVAIARAMVKEPNVILADEPTGNLDYNTSLKIMELLKKFSKQCLVVIVTHDESLANMFGDRIINISDGMIIGDVDKKDNKLNYKIIIQDNISGEKIGKIFNNKKEVMLHMESIIFKDKTNNINIVCEEIEQEAYGDKINVETKEKNAVSLGWKRLLKFAYLNYCEHKVKFIINIIVTGIMFGIVSFAAGLLFLNKIYSETKYIAENKTNIVLQQNKEYEDSFGNVKENVVYNSEDILCIAKKYVDNENIIEVFSEVEIMFEDNSITSHIWIDFQDYSLIKGSKPEKENEICITDYVAHILTLKDGGIGSIISLFGVEFVVSGIIETNYNERDIINKMNKGQMSMEEYEDVKYVYQRCVCNEKALKYIEGTSKILNIKGSDFTAKGITSYINSDMRYTAVSNLSKDDYVVYGRKPETPKEIMVSYEFATINDMLTEDDYEYKKEWRYIDISDVAYNGVYDNYVNMYEYLDGFTIVGIVGNDEDEYKGDIILLDEDYESIKNTFFEKRKDMLVLDISEIESSVLKRMLYCCDEKGITLDESVVQRIDGFFEAKGNVWYLITAIMIVFVAIMLMLNVSCIIDNVDMHRKNIGILKSLGVKKKSIHNIFYIQMILTVLCTIAIGVTSLCIMNVIVNNVINTKIQTNSVCFVGGQYGYMVLLVLCVFIFNVLCVNSTMGKVDKIQTISLLKN